MWGTNSSFEDFEGLLSSDELEEEPIPFERFVTDSKYLGQDITMSAIQIEIARHMTQVFKPETLVKLYGEQKGMDWYNKYTVNEIIAQLGKGSGKDFISRISFAYIAYLMHCLRDPLHYYGKAPGVYVDLVNLAVNAKQAQQVFFDPLKNILLASPWANDAGFEPRVSEIFWFNRPVRMFSGHSEAEGWEGYDVMVVVLDEIAAFKTDTELKGETRAKGSASQIYDMAKASVTSRFPDVGKVSLLSFPRFKGDFIQQRYKSVLDDLTEQHVEIKDETKGNRGSYREERTFAIKACTWEVNPTKKREDFEFEFRRDPIQSKSRYMCDPPEMVDAYFRDPDSVRAAFKYKESPVYSEEDEENGLGDAGTYKDWFLGTDDHARFIHVDLAKGVRDRTSLCMVHSPGFKQIKTGADGAEVLPIVEMDYIHVWSAVDNEEIDFADVRRVIYDLCRRFTVASVSFDQWQSVDMIQILNEKGINAEFHPVKKTDYDTLSTTFYDGRFRGYWNEFLVEEELLKLKLINNTKVDHGSAGYKDLADSVAGATFMCVDNMQSDIEVDIEVWRNVDYDEFTNEDMDEALDAIRPKPKKVVEKPPELPEDLSEWLLEIL